LPNGVRAIPRTTVFESLDVMPAQFRVWPPKA
jgi:hypothetical protein